MELIDVDARYAEWREEPCEATMNALLAAMRQQAYFQASYAGQHRGTEAGEIADEVSRTLFSKLDAIGPREYYGLTAQCAAFTTRVRLRRALAQPVLWLDDGEPDEALMPLPAWKITAKQLQQRLLQAA